jgi:DNA-binding transcriptional LysR family regulator
MDDGLDWNGISCFLAIARAGRLSGAAKRLGVDVATVSRRLAHFEASTQFRLFERSPGGYNLSEHGQRMLETAEAIEGSILRLRAIMDEEINCKRPVRIGAPPEFGDYFLAPRIATLCEQGTILSPQLFVSPEPYSLANRDVDLSITFERPTEGRLYARKLTDFSVGLYASEPYLRSHPPIVDGHDLDEHILIDDVPGGTQAAIEAKPSAPRGISRFWSTSFAARINATLAGVGICMLPDFVAREHTDLKRVLIDRFMTMRAFWIVVHADMRNDPQVKMAIAIILAQVRAASAQFIHDSCVYQSDSAVMLRKDTAGLEAGGRNKRSTDLSYHEA